MEAMKEIKVEGARVRVVGRDGRIEIVVFTKRQVDLKLREPGQSHRSPRRGKSQF